MAQKLMAITKAELIAKLTSSGLDDAQVFEAIGLGQDLVDEFFTGTVSRLGGVGLDELAAEVAARHATAHPSRPEERAHRDLDLGGETRGVGARVALAESIEKPLYSAVWEYDTGIRILCFIVPGTDPRLGPVNMKAIPEDKRTLELEEKAAAKPAAATQP